MWLKKCMRQKPSIVQKRNTIYKKIILVTVVCGICLVIVYWDSIFNYSGGEIRCFYESGNLLTELSTEEPDSGSSIFFHETSCFSEKCKKDCGDIPLHPRQACSVESALIAYPNRHVFLLISSPVRMPLAYSKNKLVRALLSYRNFKVRHISFSRYLSDTPLSVIDQSGALNSSRWPIPHASDVLRYATLYKFGGIYLDLDVLVLKPFDNLENFAGAESDIYLGSGILGFSLDSIGREVASECANELARTFNGRIWGFNGPGVITRVLKRRCGTSSISNMSKKACQGFDVQPVESFCAIPFTEIDIFFMEDHLQAVKNMLNKSYAVHFWNKYSSNFDLRNRSNTPFSDYAKVYCPKTYRTVGGKF